MSKEKMKSSFDSIKISIIDLLEKESQNLSFLLELLGLENLLC